MKKLLLHTCCAPCLTSSYEQTMHDFLVVPFWFNPNIEDKKEYNKRLDYFKKMNKIVAANNKILDNYDLDNTIWHKIINGLENEPEGGKRCEKCIKFRLEKTIKEAKQNQYDIFGTTMTASSQKNSKMINQIGKKLSKKYKTKYLNIDFKKKDGYLLSVKLSKKYKLYRQNYCGCKYSTTKELKKNKGLKNNRNN